MLSENLSLIQNNTAKKIKQDESQFIEYWSKRTPEDGKIDWSKPAEEIQKLVEHQLIHIRGPFHSLSSLKLRFGKQSM